MKNINKLLNIILLAYMLSGCRKTDDLQLVNTNISESLSRDSSFIILVNLELDLKNLIAENKISKNIEEDPALVNFLKQFNSAYYNAWHDLKKQYGNIKNQDIKDASRLYFEQQKLLAIQQNQIKSNSIQPNAKNHCTWGYDLCIAGVTAGAIICHSSCIGGTAGFGAPACVLLCGTIQVAAGAQCMNSYCNFIN